MVGGVSLVEVLVCVTILILALIPISTLFSSSHRIGHTARRHIAVTLQTQALLEAVAQLDTWELPAITPIGETTLLDDEQGFVANATGRWPQVVQYATRAKTADVFRKVVASRGADGRIRITVRSRWLSVAGDSRTWQTLVLSGFSSVRSWD